MLPYYSEGQQATWWVFLAIIAISIAAVFADTKTYDDITGDNFVLLRPKFIVIKVVWSALFILTAPANYWGVQKITGEFTYQLWIYIAFAIVAIFISPMLFSKWDRILVLPPIQGAAMKLWITLFLIGAALGLSIALTIVVWMQSIWAIVYLFMSLFMLYLLFIIANAAWNGQKTASGQLPQHHTSEAVSFLRDE